MNATMRSIPSFSQKYRPSGRSDPNVFSERCSIWTRPVSASRTCLTWKTGVPDSVQSVMNRSQSSDSSARRSAMTA